MITYPENKKQIFISNIKGNRILYWTTEAENQTFRNGQEREREKEK